MTIGGWVLFGFLSLIVVIVVAAGFASVARRYEKYWIIGGAVVIYLLLAGMLWYFNNTADGARRLKSQESNFNGGIERTVRVYDVKGDLIQQYDGKFDVDYDDNRIIFDDENDKRHVIYYPTGTVIIDEK